VKFNFKNYDGEKVSLQDIASIVADDDLYEVYVGTDSQVFRKKKVVKYATVIVVHSKSKGGRIFVTREVEENKSKISLRQRLANEVWRSMEVVFKLQPLLPLNAELIVHVDCNPSPAFKSGEYLQELVGTVTSQGYKCFVKPDAWAAQSVADKHSK